MEPENRKALINRLSSSEEEERRLAMEALKDGLTESDLEWLTTPLSDESWRVRKESIEGLSKLPPKPALISSLIPLMDPQCELTLRNSVVEVLERMGHEAAALLVEHLGTDQTDVRKFLVDILGNIANPDTVAPLLDLLQDPEDNIRAAAAEALASIGDPSSCGGLLKAMEGADDWVIYSILGSLAQLRCREAMPVLFQYLGHHLLSKPALAGIGAMGTVDDGIRLMKTVPALSKSSAKSALLASGSIYRRQVASEGNDAGRALRDAVSAASDESLVRALVSQLEVSDDQEERRDIVAVLGMTGLGEVIAPVLDLIEDDALSWDIDLALLTLGRADVGLILGILEHHDALVRQRAVRTLSALGSVENLDHLYGLLSDESGHVRKDAALAVSSLGDAGSIDRLLPVLDDEYSDVAQSAAQSLVLLGQRSPGKLAEKISPMLESAEAPLMSLLIMILAEVGAPGWEELCLKSAQNTEPSVRAAAVNCLKRSDSSQAVGTIINALADEDPQVRVQAAVTLEDLKHPEAFDPLKATMHDKDPWVRSAAISALSVQPEADPEDLHELLLGEDLMMQTSALDALGKMAAEGSEKALHMLAGQFETGVLEMRRSICRLLGRIDQPGAFELLRKALDDEDASIRVFAVHGLAQRAEPEIRNILKEAGDQDPDKQVREAVRSVLEAGK